jgi:tripartite-type tricarboxylate transporter receptor subunit TctC
LHQEIAAALKTPDVMSTLAAQGADAGGMRPEEFGTYFRGEYEKWGKVIRSAGIKL